MAQRASLLIRLTVLFTFLVVFFTNGAAENRALASDDSCTPVDLRGPKLGPVRHQDSLKWCASFAAADLLSYRLGQKISAVDLPLHQPKYLAQKIWDKIVPPKNQIKMAKKGEDPTVLIKESQQRGWCLEKDLPSEDNTLGWYASLFWEISLLKYTLDAGEPFEKERACRYLNTAFPGLNYETALKTLEEASLGTYYSALANQSCKNRIHDSKLIMEEKKLNLLRTNKEEIRNAIDQQLNKNNIVGVNYHSGIFKDSEAISITANHTGLIVGRRLNPVTLTCEYLIRNSWGRSCSYYTGYECEEGNIWFPINTLMNNLGNLFYAK